MSDERTRAAGILTHPIRPTSRGRSSAAWPLLAASDAVPISATAPPHYCSRKASTRVVMETLTDRLSELCEARGIDWGTELTGGLDHA